MKKQILMIVSVFALNTIIAQQLSITSNNSRITTENHRNENANNLDIMTTMLNASYFEDLNAKNTPSVIKELKQQVAKYNISDSSVFDDSEKATYRVVFKNKQGKLVVIYNNQGEILNSVEKYKNIAIPSDLRIAISKEYPGWAFQENKYSITYNKDNGFNKSYKIELKKGNLKKTLRINS